MPPSISQSSTTRYKPLGTFARSRRDWNAERMMSGGQALDSAAGFGTISLFNDDNTGHYLAVYEIIFQVQKAGDCELDWYMGQDANSFYAPGVPCRGDGPTMNGLIGINGDQSTNTSAFVSRIGIYPAGGKVIHLRSDGPLFLIPAGWSLLLSEPNLPATFNPCSFIWGMY